MLLLVCVSVQYTQRERHSGTQGRVSVEFPLTHTQDNTVQVKALHSKSQLSDT